jgi:hypothetical protein
LQSTLWMIEGGLRSSAQVVNRFRVIHKLAPEWERGSSDGLIDHFPLRKLTSAVPFLQDISILPNISTVY